MAKRQDDEGRHKWKKKLMNVQVTGYWTSKVGNNESWKWWNLEMMKVGNSEGWKWWRMVKMGSGEVVVKVENGGGQVR